jgi:inner membrane protein
MTWRTHVMGGLVSLWIVPLGGWILPSGIDTTSLVLAIIFALLGSLLPDLDARESKLSNMQIGGVTPLKPAAWFLNRSLGHRGVMHSLLALLIASLVFSLPLALFLDSFAGVGLALGYLSHLLLDACTKSGVPLYWPDNKRVHLLPRQLRFVTGSSAEDALFILLALVAAGFLLNQFFQLSPPFQPSPTYESQTVYSSP